MVASHIAAVTTILRSITLSNGNSSITPSPTLALAYWSNSLAEEMFSKGDLEASHFGL